MFDRQVPVTAQWNSAFLPVNRTRAFWRVVMGAAGSGKSYNLAQDFIKKLSDPRFSGTHLLVVRKIEETHRDSTFAELSGAIDRLFGPLAGRVWKSTLSPLSLVCLTTGNRIIFRGLKDQAQREKLKSVTAPHGKLTWIWVEEATELTQDDVDMLALRLRGPLDGGATNPYYQITLSFNPVSSAHWLRRRFFLKPDSEVFLHRSTYRDNRFLGPDYEARMERLRTDNPELYRVYALGEWGETGGLIFTNWSVLEFPCEAARFDAVAIGQDFGFNHANAIVSVGMRDGDIYVRGELYEREKDTTELIRLAEGRVSRSDIMWCDAAEPDRILMWRKAGFRARAVKKHPGAERAQIDFLKGRRLFLHPSCVHTQREIGRWKWVRDERAGVYTDVPQPFDNDAMSALRYAVADWVRATPGPLLRKSTWEIGDGVTGGAAGRGYLDY